MKRPSDGQATFEDLIGLGDQSARKSYYPELERKVAELERERNRYKWLFDNALHGIFRAEVDAQLHAVNNALLRICGYHSEQQMLHQVGAISELFFRGEEYQNIIAKLRAYGHLTGRETALRRSDGSAVKVSVNLLLKQEDGREVVEAFVADITERMRAQERMKQLNQELEQRVNRRTQELQLVNDQLRDEITERELVEQYLVEARDQAEEANRSKDKYLAAASHDLLQPMNAARLLVATLRERQLPAKEGHLVERIHLALNGAEELLTDLLDIARLDQNAVQPDFVDIPVGHIFYLLETEFQPLARNNNVGLRVRSRDLYIRSDSRLLIRILRNFLSNAFRYTPHGRVLLGCRVQGDKLSIQVWDTGQGIEQEQLGRIFEEFHQVRTHHMRERQGVGLGLAIVDRIARVLDHQINVASVPGAGSVFSIDVPLANVQAGSLSYVMPQPVADPLNDCRVLVVDNEEYILASMRALLEQWGCHVSTAQDMEQALCQYQRAGRVDILLVDYHLDDDRTGLEVIDAIRADQPGIPAVMVTADRSADTRQQFKEQGLQILSKPVKPGKLRALLTHLLGAQASGN